ncbi:hypothetical protein [Bacillus sp. (in: firmicutes)]|uniref:phage baseplate protein n=1 Tax=Bacillus sp. TaxID=1409 RepID=UPI003211ECEF
MVELTGDIYATLVASGNRDKSESIIITRMNQNGVMLDSITRIQGSHATTIGLERKNGKIYIYPTIMLRIQTETLSETICAFCLHSGRHTERGQRRN